GEGWAPGGGGQAELVTIPGRDVLLAGQNIGQILLMAVVQLIFGGFGGRSVLHDWGCVRGGVLGYRSLGPSGEKLPQASAETLLELPEPGLGRAGVRSGVRDRPVAERDLRQRARGVHG